MTIPTKPRDIQYCTTCHTKIRLDGVDYIRMKPTFDWDAPNYYCSQRCLFETPHVDADKWKRKRNTQ